MFFLTDNERRPPETATALAKEARGVVVQVNTFGRLSLPIMKTWGNQRMLRCVNGNGKGEGDGSGGNDSAGGKRFSETEGIGSGDPEGGSGDSSAIEEVREKLLVHLREAADRIKLIVHETPALPLPPSRGDGPRAEAVRAEEAAAEPPSSSAPPTWPWKLRTRRRGARVRVMSEHQASGSLAVAGEKRAARRSERPDFSITLTREEIDEDIYAVTGYRARRRPRRRPRVVQKQLDLLFPGSWLSEITYDCYKVTD